VPGRSRHRPRTQAAARSRIDGALNGGATVLRQGDQFILAVQFARPSRQSSQVAALGLFPLDRLEQGLEVALAESFRAVPLDQLEEYGWPVLRRLVKICSR
jgi:hypothetical protein